MKERKILKALIIIFMLIIGFKNTFELHADTENDYLTYQEIIMSSGKLMRDFTEEELEEMYKKLKMKKGFAIYIDSNNVEASYIASTTEIIENNSSTTVDRNISVVVETNNKVSINTTVSASVSSKIAKNIKTEIAASTKLEYSKTTTKSVKKTQSLNVKIESNTQYMVIVEGKLRITNGVLSFLFLEFYHAPFETVTIESQYYRYEVRSL